MTEKEVVCIVCPSSCRLTVREENGTITVEGNGCKRGIEHGISEFTNPMRMLTSTVVVNGGSLPRLPVISTGEVPKAKLTECLTLLYGVAVSAPVTCGDVIVKDICGTGVDVVASRSMKVKEA
jgi:CxxC motif-containing protein